MFRTSKTEKYSSTTVKNHAFLIKTPKEKKSVIGKRSSKMLIDTSLSREPNPLKSPTPLS